jgi:hypothetical protein
MSGAIPQLMVWTGKNLIFNTMKARHQLLVMLVYVGVLQHRRKNSLIRCNKNVNF